MSIIDKALAKKGAAADPERLLQAAANVHPAEADAGQDDLATTNPAIRSTAAAPTATAAHASEPATAPASAPDRPAEPQAPPAAASVPASIHVSAPVSAFAAAPASLAPGAGAREPAAGSDAPQPRGPVAGAHQTAVQPTTPHRSVPAARPVLVVEDLRVAFPGRDGGWNEAVRGVTFALGRERLGIVGESGSGKSQTGRAILGLSAQEARVSARRLEFHGTDLLTCSPKERRALRGGRIAMVLQDPKFSLNPVMTIGAQIVETLRAHSRVSMREARERALEALAAVQIDQPERVFGLYPHEVSGGMGQRAMIAMMLIADPELLIADEPTSALDVTVQLQVLSILDRLVQERGMGLVFISHDLRLVSTFCDRILVMYAGKVVEEVSSGALADAQHPYTRGLLDCLPRLGDDRHPLPTLERRAQWAL